MISVILAYSSTFLSERNDEMLQHSDNVLPRDSRIEQITFAELNGKTGKFNRKKETGREAEEC